MRQERARLINPIFNHPSQLWIVSTSAAKDDLQPVKIAGCQFGEHESPVGVRDAGGSEGGCSCNYVFRLQPQPLRSREQTTHERLTEFLPPSCLGRAFPEKCVGHQVA